MEIPGGGVDFVRRFGSPAMLEGLADPPRGRRR
jgi:hypothetical protein